MGQDPPGWYYVGNGQLRYKFGDFWTDQYKTIGRSERAVPTASIESSDPVPAHTSPNVRLPHLRTPRALIAVCTGLLGLGVGGGLLKPDVRHEWVSWAAAQASHLSALISRPAPPSPARTPDVKVKADATTKARADARFAAKVKATPPGLVAPHAPAANPKTKAASPPAAPAHASTKPPVTPPSRPPRSTPRSVANPR